jgi:hypothetical protein
LKKYKKVSKNAEGHADFNPVEKVSKDVHEIFFKPTKLDENK